jgi:PAS domain S-box-containing protein
MVEVPLAHHGSDAGVLPSQALSIDVVTVLESIGDAFYMLDRDWCFGYVNGVAERMWARRRDGLLGRDIRLAFPQLIGSDLASAIDAALTEGNSIRLETIDPVLCAPIELNIVANPAGAAIYFRAVTPRRRLSHAGGEHDEMLAIAEKSSGIGVWELDLGTGMLLGTAQFYRIMGLAPTTASVPIETTRRLRHPEDQDRIDQLFHHAVASGRDYLEAEYRIVRPDGLIRWIFGRVRVIRDAHGTPIRWSGVDVDITDRKLAEERADQLASSRAQLQAFFDNSPDWLTLQRVTPDGHIVYADLNPTCEVAYGMTRDQVVGRTVEEVLGREAAQVPLRSLRDCLKTGEPQRYVARRTMSGQTRAIDVMFVLVPGQTDSGDRFIITTARDITDREQLEAQLRQAQKMEALGQLTGGVAHDFNNLLAVIGGNAELARRRPAANLAKQMDNILRATQRGVALTRQLLSFSRRHAASPQLIDLRVEMPRMAEMLRASLRGNIQMRLDIADHVSSVETDLAELEIAMLNIAVNARDAMPQGGFFTIDVQNVKPGSRDSTLASDHVVITLRDSGVGIPPDVIGKVFDPFFTTKEPGEGTGLGLSQVYGFAQQSGGTVSLDSQPGSGTTVTLRLPRSRKKMPAARGDEHAASETQVHARILLVEDNPQVADVTAQMLDSMGFDVEVADRARKALERLGTTAEHVDLLMTDVVMPDGMNGLELATQVRAKFPTLPIVLISGYNDVVATDGSAFPVMRKPVPYDELYRMVSACLKNS